MTDDDPRIPTVSPLVAGLLKSDSVETEDAMALVGFVGPGRDGDVRLYPDIDFQRWMDIPTDDIVAHAPLDEFNSARRARTVVWVKREAMFRPVFNPESLNDLTGDFAGSWMSTWHLIPESRLVAAQMLDLVPRLTFGKRD